MKTIPASCLALGLLLPSCDPVEPAGENGGAAKSKASNPQDGDAKAMPSVETKLTYEFKRWRDDFPYSLHVPPRRLGLWYDRNSQQALNKIVENLSGLCTKPAWMMAKEFFDRHWDESRDLLIEKLDECLRKRTEFDHAENILGVMGRATSPEFAKVLVRAAAHEQPGIRRAAFRALQGAGDAEAVMAVGQGFTRMSRVEQRDWIKAAAAHLEDKDLFELFREFLTKQQFAGVHAIAFEEAMKLKPERAARFFEPIWSSFPEDLQLHVAGIMHAAGDERGTIRLRHALKPPVKVLNRKLVAVEGARRGDPTPLVNELLQLTNEDHEGLNVMIIAALRQVKTQPVTDTLITLADRSKPYQVRQHALLALAERGHTRELDEVLEIVRKEPEGAEYRDAIADLVAARYGKGATVMLERMKKAARKSEIFYVRMIARIDRPESFQALREVFLRPEYRYEWRERHSNVTFLGVQFANLPSCVDDLIGLLGEIPLDDHRRRAALIHALANMAGAKREDLAYSGKIYDVIRKVVFDPKELPQVRILALDYIRKDVRLQDAANLKARLAKEESGMRQYLSDYLFEFF